MNKIQLIQRIIGGEYFFLKVYKKKCFLLYLITTYVDTAVNTTPDFAQNLLKSSLRSSMGSSSTFSPFSPFSFLYFIFFV